MPVHFEQPLWLLLLLGVPPLVIAGQWATLAGLSRGRRATTALVRGVFLATVIAALARPYLAIAVRDTSAVLLVDTSDSIPVAELERARQLANAATLARPKQSTFSVLSFGATAARLTTDELHHPLVRLSPGETNIANALQLSLAHLDSDKVRRVILFSDGKQTTEDAVAASALLAAAHVRVDTLAVAAGADAEVMVRALELPGEIKVGAPILVKTSIFSSVAQPATVTAYRDGEPLAEQTVQTRLNAGENNFQFSTKVVKAGLHEFVVRVTSSSEPLRDRFKQNNRAAAVVRALGPPRVLYAEGTLPSAHYLTRALREGNIDVDVVAPTALPTDLHKLESYDLVILSDIAASFIGDAQRVALETFVRDRAGGLIVAGGENSFGSGGYSGTAFEKLLPVRFEGEKKREQPALALALLIDRSGSMNGEKMELAKDAAKATAEVLGPDDLLSVIAFDAEAHSIVRLERAANRLRISNDISRIVASGGTNILPALREAFEELATAAAKVKHVIVLTDGQASYDGLKELVDKMVAARISVSAVGVGTGADKTLLTMIAERGGGRFYFTEDARNIPRIFTKETKEVARSSIVEQAGRPRVVKPAQFLDGIDFNRAPPLRGFVTATPKPLSETHLVMPEGEPLLVRWRQGLGQVVVFTSDVKNRWAQDWLAWPGYPQLFNQLVRATMRTGQARGTVLPMRMQVAAPFIDVSVDAQSKDDRFMTGLSSQLTITALDPAAALTQKELVQRDLSEIAPGLYHARIRVPDVGAFDLHAQHRADGSLIAESFATINVPYSTEYLPGPPDETLLAALRQHTGGRSEPTVAQFFDAGSDVVPARRALWSYLLWAAMALLLVDVLGRRLPTRAV